MAKTTSYLLQSVGSSLVNRIAARAMTRVQTYLRDSVGAVPDHHNKASKTQFFLFSSA